MTRQKICGIYKITCIINDKCYIGSSIDINYRWKQHKYILIRNKHHSIRLQNSWNKYGEDKFIFEIMEECSQEKEIILAREQFYIDSLNPFFNICKIAGNTLGKKHSEESKKKLSIAHSGENNYWYGKKRKGSSFIWKNTIPRRKDKNKQKVYCCGL